ncbi:MAG: hypothetical protein DRP10_03765 [Candidatus Aenigmatarchaeota archaeon]|nr:MAG: hypothetical protein DRP10_03765 [Candidatus Aenigmarchaeota archaeon]
MGSNLADRVAIVTGAMRGIGKAIALKLAKEGAKVVVTDVDQEECKEVVKEIEEMGRTGLALELDVTNEEDWHNAVKEVKEKFGKIDILINNAGICDLEEAGDISKMEKILSVNLKGTIIGCNAVLPLMIEQKYGKIVNISSIAAIVSWPKIPTYSATKGGVIGLTKCYAGYLGQYNINVNTIAPGPIETKMLDDVLKKLGMTRDMVCKAVSKGRIGRPEDIANAVAFLASDDADYITGQVLVVDGGYTVK